MSARSSSRANAPKGYRLKLLSVATTGARAADISSLRDFCPNAPTLVCCGEDARVDSPSIGVTAQMKCIRGGSLAPSFDRPHTEGARAP